MAKATVFQGLIEKGNIDLKNRPIVKHAGGDYSTVHSMSFNDGKHEVLIPMVHDQGYMMDEKQAIQNYKETGKHLGKFKTPQHATKYAEKLHEDQAKFYKGVR